MVLVRSVGTQPEATIRRIIFMMSVSLDGFIEAPVVISRGRPMFRTEERLHFRLADTRSFGNGVVLLRYLSPSS